MDNKKLITSTDPKIAEAVTHIRCAIRVLSSVAKSDPVAREALINLGVVAIDLNSTKSPRR